MQGPSEYVLEETDERDGAIGRNFLAVITVQRQLGSARSSPSITGCVGEEAGRSFAFWNVEEGI